MAANGFGEHSPGGYSLAPVLIIEVVLAPMQLWAFWLAPLVGAAIAGIAYPFLFGRNEELADRPVRDDALEESATT